MNQSRRWNTNICANNSKNCNPIEKSSVFSCWALSLFTKLEFRKSDNSHFWFWDRCWLLLEYSRRLIYPWRSTNSCAIKIRLLTLGPTTSTQSVHKTLQMFHTVVQLIEESNINKFWDVESTGTLSNTELYSNSQFLTSRMLVRWPLYTQQGSHGSMITLLCLPIDIYVKRGPDPWPTSLVRLPTCYSWWRNHIWLTKAWLHWTSFRIRDSKSLPLHSTPSS